MIFRTLFMFAILAGCHSCQKLKPKEVNVSEYPDIEKIYLSQVETLRYSSLRKVVTLDEKSETQFFQSGKIKWEDELSFLKEINPLQPEYTGAFNKKINGDEIILTLKKGQKGMLKKVALSQKEEDYNFISASIHEDKYVYTHHREVKIRIENGTINFYDIQGYHKVILQDIVKFRIVGNID